jgi:predicted nucleic acid-binding protein
MPHRVGNHAIAERYESLLTRSRGIRLVDLTRDQLRAAAHLRGAAGVKTPDGLQLVNALSTRCKTLVTNDRRLPPIPGLRVLLVSSYARDGPGPCPSLCGPTTRCNSDRR